MAKRSAIAWSVVAVIFSIDNEDGGFTHSVKQNYKTFSDSERIKLHNDLNSFCNIES